MGNRVSVVTGGSGFIGSHVVRQLVAQGDQVRVLDLNPPAADLADRVEFRNVSILDRDAVGQALAGADRLFHLAANPNLWARDKSQLAEVNFHGTQTVLAAAATSALERIVVTSTETILKSYKDRSSEPISEKSRLPELEALPGYYSRSKMRADIAARQAMDEGLPVTIVNPTVPVGEGDVSFTPPTKMILGFVDGSTPAYLDCVLNLIAVQDVAAGHILAAEKGRVGERYILSGENVRLGRVLEILEEITGKPMPKRKVPYWLSYAVGVVSEFMADYITRTPPIAPLEGVRVAGTAMSFDNTKARAELGLKLTPLADALRQSVDWLRAEGHFAP